MTNPQLNGAAALRALVQDIGCAPGGDAAYNLGRGYHTLTAVAGIDDKSPDGTVNPTVFILGDGRQLGTFAPTLGKPVDVNIDVTGVLRLEVKWTYTRPPQVPIPINCAPNATLVIANAQLTKNP